MAYRTKSPVAGTLEDLEQKRVLTPRILDDPVAVPIEHERVGRRIDLVHGLHVVVVGDELGSILDHLVHVRHHHRIQLVPPERRLYISAHQLGRQHAFHNGKSHYIPLENHFGPVDHLYCHEISPLPVKMFRPFRC